MPEKRYHKGCGKGCLRCWRNNLKHGNKLKKKLFPQQNKWYSSDEDPIEKIPPVNYNNMSPVKEFYHRHIKVEVGMEANKTQYIYDLYCEWLGAKKGIKKRPNFNNFNKEFDTIARDATCSSFYSHKCTYTESCPY